MFNFSEEHKKSQCDSVVRSSKRRGKSKTRGKNQQIRRLLRFGRKKEKQSKKRKEERKANKTKMEGKSKAFEKDCRKTEINNEAHEKTFSFFLGS